MEEHSPPLNEGAPLFFPSPLMGETSKNTWLQIGDTAFRLRKQGITIPLTDVLIAILARENDCDIYTLDSNFEKIPGIKLYEDPYTP